MASTFSNAGRSISQTSVGINATTHMADTEIALPYTWGAASVSDAVDAGTLQPSKTASASKQTASLLRSNQSLGSTGGSGSLLQRQGLNNRSAEATLLPSKS